MNIKLKSIMLIDDNEDDNYFHQVILDEMQICEQVQVAESGFEALHYLRFGEVIPELIFLDINMPKMNGWEFLVEYDKLDLERKAKVVIIMLTTSLNPADRDHAESISSVSGFESKPLSASMLERIMGKFFPEFE